MHLIVAVDPGVSGGVAWTDGQSVETCPMPSSDSDVAHLMAELSCKAKEVSLFLEEPPLYAGKNIPGSAIGKLMWNTGVLYGAAIVMGFKVHRVRPAIWMKAHPVGTKGEQTTSQWKARLKNRAQELFPTCDVTLKTADALLILDAARRGAIN